MCSKVSEFSFCPGGGGDGDQIEVEFLYIFFFYIYWTCLITLLSRTSLISYAAIALNHDHLENDWFVLCMCKMVSKFEFSYGWQKGAGIIWHLPNPGGHDLYKLESTPLENISILIMLLVFLKRRILKMCFLLFLNKTLIPNCGLTLA